MTLIMKIIWIDDPCTTDKLFAQYNPGRASMLHSRVGY